jgi:uncharacterized membrane protein
MTPRQRDIALIVSISLNVFLIGAAITVYALREARAAITGAERSSMRVAASNLDAPHKAAFIRLLHGQGQTIQAETRAARAIRDSAWDSLGAPAFDPAEIKRRLAQARELNVLAHRTVEDAVVDFAVGLSPAQRASLSQSMRHAASHQRPDASRERPSTP